MDWPEALDLVVALTKHERYRHLCSDSHPDHDAYRALVIELATGTPAEYPSLVVQAVNLAGAIGRAVGAAVRGEEVGAPLEVVEARQAECSRCPQYDPCAARCRLCGCATARKLRLATEACPLDPPRWDRWSPEIGAASPRTPNSGGTRP